MVKRTELCMVNKDRDRDSDSDRGCYLLVGMGWDGMGWEKGKESEFSPQDKKP